MTRKKTDWEKIEREYRAGQLSIREIARTHNISDTAIRKKAKENNWARDLTNDIRARIRSQAVRTDDPRTEEEIIQDAAARGVAIVRDHQRRLGALSELADEMTGKALEIKDVVAQANVTRTITETLNKLICLERQAFNLDAGPVGDGQITISWEK